jgi:protease I
MAQKTLQGKRIAILATEGVEEVELVKPREALDEAGAETYLVSPESGKIKSWHFNEWGDEYDVDTPLDEAKADDYDALFIPGGVMSPDHLRMNGRAVEFVRSFAASGKPIASICHGPWMLAEADLVRGKKVTSWPSLQTDLRNAGAEWVDQEVVRDGEMVTSRKPDDIPAFNREIVELFAGGGAVRRAA